jgi:hypothetical protein
MRQGVIPCDAARLPQPAISAQDKADLDRCFDRYGLDDPKYRPSGRASGPWMQAAE